MRWRKEREPERPQGVRITRRSGEVVECELVYEGKEDGLDVWTITSMIQPGDRFSAEVFPARCSIQCTGLLPPGTKDVRVHWRDRPDGPERETRVPIDDA